jgi:hypothetical protein
LLVFFAVFLAGFFAFFAFLAFFFAAMIIPLNMCVRRADVVMRKKAYASLSIQASRQCRAGESFLKRVL